MCQNAAFSSICLDSDDSNIAIIRDTIVIKILIKYYVLRRFNK